MLVAVEVLDGELRVANNNVRHLAQVGPCPVRGAVQVSSEIVEEPGPPLASAAHGNTHAAGLRHDGVSVFHVKDVPVPKHRQDRMGNKLADLIPMRVPSIVLGHRAGVQCETHDPIVRGDRCGITEG